MPPEPPCKRRGDTPPSLDSPPRATPVPHRNVGGDVLDAPLMWVITTLTSRAAVLVQDKFSTVVIFRRVSHFFWGKMAVKKECEAKMLPKKSPFFRRLRIKYIHVDEISTGELPSRIQPELETLEKSIARYGILSPLIVRSREEDYALICGGRRLAAAKACGIKKVPCLIAHCTPEDDEALRIIDNHQRQQPDFTMTAEALKSLIYAQGYSIGEAAALAGLTFDDAAEKLRTLSLGRRLLRAVVTGGLTQRHAAALLRLGDERARETALCEMAYRRIGEYSADGYVDALISHGETPAAPSSARVYIMKDVRMFLNTVDHCVSIMKAGGIDAAWENSSVGGDMVITVTIPGAAEKLSAG